MSIYVGGGGGGAAGTGGGTGITIGNGGAGGAGYTTIVFKFENRIPIDPRWRAMYERERRFAQIRRGIDVL